MGDTFQDPQWVLEPQMAWDANYTTLSSVCTLYGFPLAHLGCRVTALAVSNKVSLIKGL